MSSKRIANMKISGDITAQALGLTDQHIHYFEQTTDTKPLGIHQHMLRDFDALTTSAQKSGLEIKIASGFRSFERQLFIWNNKFVGKNAIKNLSDQTVDITQLTDAEIMKAILLFSALPGASRHHWGCDIDIYAKNLLTKKPLQLEPWEYASTGPMAELSTWLNQNAIKFGFYFPYDQFRGGVAAEPWHLSYLPLAEQYQSILTVELLQALLLTTDIQGKKSIVEQLPMIFKQYINNIKMASLPDRF